MSCFIERDGIGIVGVSGVSCADIKMQCHDGRQSQIIVTSGELHWTCRSLVDTSAVVQSQQHTLCYGKSNLQL